MCSGHKVKAYKTLCHSHERLNFTKNNRSSFWNCPTYKTENTYKHRAKWATNKRNPKEGTSQKLIIPIQQVNFQDSHVAQATKSPFCSPLFYLIESHCLIALFGLASNCAPFSLFRRNCLYLFQSTLQFRESTKFTDYKDSICKIKENCDIPLSNNIHIFLQLL